MLYRRLARPGEWAEVRFSTADYRGALQAAARRAVPALADWCTIHLVEDDADEVGVAGVHHDAAREVYVQALRRYPPRCFPDAVPGAGAPSVPDPLAWATDEAHAKLLRALRPSAVLAIPLEGYGRVLGLVVFGNDAGRGGFSAGQRAAARLCADVAAAAVARARLARDADVLRDERRFLFEEHSLPMWVIDAESLAFLAVNDEAVRRYGWSREEFLGMTLMDLRPERDGAAPGSDSRPRRADVAVSQHRRKDGSRLDVEIVSRAVVWHGRRARLVVVQDVTERLRTEAALRRADDERRKAQRMDVAGRLAGGVAHDFNNVLTTIQGYSEILLRTLGASDPRREDVDAIRVAADRGAALARQLLAFAERERGEPRPTDLNAVVTSMESLVQRLAGADVQVVTIRAPVLGRIRIDPALLEQVLVSLVLNACESMPRGGTLTVETSERHLAASGRHRSMQPGLYAVLAVSDTGGRVDGAGAELPMVNSIVRQHGGTVRVAGEPGQGTTVKAYFPVDSATPAEEEPATRAGDEMVLVVEDEEPVRELLRKLLASQGYRVLEARHGMDALRILERHRGPLDLMITDVVMPEIDGLELAERVRMTRPDLPVLFISGYTSDEVMRRGAGLPSGAFVHKPVASDELLAAVRRLLDAASAPAA
jgi:PAS domain S-box-containing protein